MPVTDSPFEETTSGNFRPARVWRVADNELPSPPVNWRRVGMIGVAITGVLLVLFGLWRFTQPRTYRQVAEFDGVDVVLIPSQQGFLYREAPQEFVLHDWVNGAVRWRADMKTPSASNIKFALSPSGRYFAVLATSKGQMRLQTWDDGKLNSETAFTTTGSLRSHLKVLDDGRVFVWPSDQRRDSAELLKDGKVIARGQLIPGISSSISPDGTAIVSARRNFRFSYAAITVKDGRILLANRYVGSEPITVYRTMSGYNFDGCLFNNGLVLTNNGALFGQTGKITGGTGWEHEEIAPGGMYAFEHQGKQARVISPLQGQSWSFTVPGDRHARGCHRGWPLCADLLSHANVGVSARGGERYSHVGPGVFPGYPGAV